MQELEEQLEIERELKVIADQEDAEQLEMADSQPCSQVHPAVLAGARGRQKPQEGEEIKEEGWEGAKAGGKTTEGDKKASGAKKADGAAKGKKKK